MIYFAVAVFALHTLAELAFGARAFLKGAFSSQGADEVAAQPAHLAAAARFLGAALFALGLLGAIIVLGPGATSAAGDIAAAVFCIFHALGVAGVFLTAQQNDGFLAQSHARGAMVVHLVLAVGFALVLLLV